MNIRKLEDPIDKQEKPIDGACYIIKIRSDISYKDKNIWPSINNKMETLLNHNIVARYIEYEEERDTIFIHNNVSPRMVNRAKSGLFIDTWGFMWISHWINSIKLIESADNTRNITIKMTTQAIKQQLDGLT